MSNKSENPKAGDASGRGAVAGYRVNFPARMRAYTEAEIAAVVGVMRNAEVQTQGEAPIIGSLYVQKWYVGNAASLKVTVEVE